MKVKYGKEYSVQQNGKHWTLTSDDGSVITFDWYRNSMGSVLENIVGASRSVVGSLVYQIWFKLK